MAMIYLDNGVLHVITKDSKQTWIVSHGWKAFLATQANYDLRNSKSTYIFFNREIKGRFMVINVWKYFLNFPKPLAIKIKSGIYFTIASCPKVGLV
jgi:hypothetical protein